MGLVFGFKSSLRDSAINCQGDVLLTQYLRLWGMSWPQTGVTLPCTVRTFRKSSCNQRVGCLLYSLTMISSLIYRMCLWTSARCIGLVPCCGQDGYQAQVLQQPIVLAVTISLPFARFVISLIQSRIIWWKKHFKPPGWSESKSSLIQYTIITKVFQKPKRHYFKYDFTHNILLTMWYNILNFC